MLLKEASLDRHLRTGDFSCLSYVFCPSPWSCRLLVFFVMGSGTGQCSAESSGSPYPLPFSAPVEVQDRAGAGLAALAE